MKIAVTSLGCNKNLVDTEVMLAHLGRVGCVLIDEPEEADCLLINTCSFLTDAVEESLDCIIGLAQLKGKGGPGRLVVTGCLVSRYGDEILKKIPEIDALVPPNDLESVVKAVKGGEKQGAGRSPSTQLRAPSLSRGAQGGTKQDAGRSTEGGAAKQATSNVKRQTSNVKRPDSDPQSSILNSQLSFPPRVLSYPPHRAYLKIGEGCSNYCSYCLIPSIRGEFVSRTPESLRAEMEHLVRSGVREITLVAQDSGRFGIDLERWSLPSLIESLLSVSGDYWLRVLYVHPSRVTEDLLAVMKSDPRLCRYLDVPFQHVSPEILRKMGRADAPHPSDIVRRIRKELPDIFLRTTFMAGFPGETERDFEFLVRFLHWARFDHLGVFSYSREEGTPAFNLKDQVPPQMGKDRAGILMEEQSGISTVQLKGCVGKKMIVLVEGQDETGPYGRHQGQAPEVDGIVHLDREVEPGSFVTVRITGSDVYDLTGEVLE